MLLAAAAAAAKTPLPTDAPGAGPAARASGGKPPPSAEAVRKELLRLRKVEKELGGRVQSLQGTMLLWLVERTALLLYCTVPGGVMKPAFTTPSHQPHSYPTLRIADELSKRERQLAQCERDLEEDQMQLAALQPQLQRYQGWLAGGWAGMGGSYLKASVTAGAGQWNGGYSALCLPEEC